jgi:hypothetical protein
VLVEKRRRVGNAKVRYRVEDLEAFIEASLRRNTGQAGAEELASSAKTRP